MRDDHEACYHEMKQIDHEWWERFEKSNRVKQVLRMNEPGNYEVLQIVDIYQTYDGLEIIVR